MLTLKKLASLAEGTRRRKTVVLLRDFERGLLKNGHTDGQERYLRGLLELTAWDEAWPREIRRRALNLADLTGSDTGSETAEGWQRQPLVRGLNNLRHTMLENLGRDWADWDAEMPGDEEETPNAVRRPMRVYADGIRSPFNLGSIMRTALAFGAECAWISPEGCSPDHRRARRSAMGAVDRLPWEVTSLDSMDDSRTGAVFALELGGQDVNEFTFPRNGTVVIGSEELGVSPEALKRAEESAGVVSINLPGPKASLNVGVAFGILMQHWSATAAED